jgi:hypothetical protein
MQLISSPGEAAKYLYAIVAPQKVKDGKALSVNFATAAGTYGKFAFQGDSVIWTPPAAGDVKRKNNAAWFVCEGGKLLLNLGDYLGAKVEGCADHTVRLSPFLDYFAISLT